MKFSSRTLVAALALASAASAIAQVAPDPIAPLPTAKGQLPASQLPASQLPVPLPTPPAPPVVLPPPFWPLADATDLLSVIQSVGAEGLTPRDYNPAGLADAIASRDANRVAQVATDSFNKLSSDFAFGHVRGEDRIDWHVVDGDLTNDRQRALLDLALSTHRVGDALRGLLAPGGGQRCDRVGRDLRDGAGGAGEGERCDQGTRREFHDRSF